jgi:hypothetical protein
MLILGWETNDWRGRKVWAALWTNDDTPALRDDARRYLAEHKLDGDVFAEDGELTEAKERVRAALIHKLTEGKPQ